MDFDFSWCPQLEKLYAGKVLVGQTGREFTNAGSLSTRRNIHLIRCMMMDLRPRRTLEVGLAFGGSALAIAASHQQCGNGSSGVHTAIDLAQTSAWDNVANLQLMQAGLEDLVRIIELPSSIGLAQLAASPEERFDLIYIDGSHQFEDVFVDFYFSSRLLNIGGVVLFDDCADRHVAKVLRFIDFDYRGTYAAFPLEKYLTDRRERIRRRIAGLLGRGQMSAFRKLRDANASRHFVDF